MKMSIIMCGFFCLLASRVESKPQITKLFPVTETIDYPEEMSNEVKPLDKFLGKLRATYNFVFRKPENTSNVEKILSKDAPNPDVETLKLIWSNRMRPSVESKSDKGSTNIQTIRGDKMLSITTDDWINDIRPLAPLELQEGIDDADQETENLTPGTSLQLPVTLSRHLVEWLGSLLGLTYDVYAKLARVVHNKIQ